MCAREEEGLDTDTVPLSVHIIGRWRGATIYWVYFEISITLC
eukprot:COSAG01_NODE_8944_length_2607_cov_5.086523_2_plen_42_part_00